MNRFFKRAAAGILSAAMCASMLPMMRTQAKAANTQDSKSSTLYEPWKHGYRFIDLLNFDPETDPYAKEMRASVPLQERNDTFAATQANPGLSDRAKLYAISSGNYRSTDVTEGPWNGNASYDDFSYNLFKFWQYTDMIGSGGRPTQSIVRGTVDKEYGTIGIPMQAAINAAHKNGVLAIAEYFIPRPSQYTEEWLYKDENGEFPYAKKMVEIARYFGFDGYFINQEESIDSKYVPLMKEAIQYLRGEGLYIQWYDSITESGMVSYQNAFNSTNSGWILSDNQRVADSIFLNYWYSSSALKNSKALAEQLGLDPYEVVFMGVEGGQWGFGTDIETRYNCVDENGQPYTSFAIWGSDFYHEQYNRPDGRYQVQYQWQAEQRERQYFTSNTEYAGDYSGSNALKGFSKYVVEKSVINGTTFASDFNNGHGMQYFRNGAVSRDMEWTNLNLQDILPTWQWWVESTDENRFQMDWDYGSEYTRVEGAFPYTQIGAYNGGSSLVIYGDVQGSQTVNLYKTNMDITAATKLALTYNKPSADDTSTMRLALVFQNAEGTDVEETAYVAIPDSGKQTAGWVTAELDLSQFAGKKLAAFGVEISATEKVEGYQMNLGRVAITDGTDYTPDVPTGLTLAHRFDETKELQLTWDLGDYETVKNYHVYAKYADGSVRFVGGGYADNFYIATLEDEANVIALELRAVGADGSESEGASVSLAQENRVSGIQAASADNKLIVTWTDPEADFANVEVSLEYFYSNKVAPDAVTVAKGAQNASFDIDLEDGARYILKVTTVNANGSKNEAVSYFGELADNYCEPYDGVPHVRPNGGINLPVPSAHDWKACYVEINGSTSTYRRGSNMLRGISIPSGSANMVITLEDMDGNKSVPKTIMFRDGVPVDLNEEFGEKQIPDAALRAALQEKVGKTLGDLFDFVGALDLSNLGIQDLTGLTLLSGLTEVNLSGNALTEVTNTMIPSGVTKLNLSNIDTLVKVTLTDRANMDLNLADCTALTDLYLKNFGDKELTLSGCVNLLNLDISGATLTSLNIKSLTKLHNFNLSNSTISELISDDAAVYTNAYYWNWKNAKLDLSETTAEGTLFAGMKHYFATAELEEEVDPQESVLLNRGNTSSTSKIDLTLPSYARITKITYKNDYDEGYGINAGTVSVSDDGENYTQVAEFSGVQLDEEKTIELPAGTCGQYVRIDVTSGRGWGYNMKVWGHTAAPMGFAYAGQQPAYAYDEIEHLTVPDDGKEYQLLDLLNARFASAKLTKSGALLSSVLESDWIDAAYAASALEAPKGVRVDITDPEGNPYTAPVEGPTLGTIEDTKLNVSNIIASAQNSGEEGKNLFDGDRGSKWCTGSNGAWVGFTLDEARVLGKWFTLHAGCESSSMITSAYRLQILDTEKVTEADYMAMSESEMRNVLRDSNNWKDLVVVTGNADDEVTIELGMDQLASAQVYRFIVDSYTQPGAQYGAVRVYEMELYAYSGQLGTNVNGILKAENEGVYNVSYVAGGQVIGATTVTVVADPSNKLTIANSLDSEVIKLYAEDLEGIQLTDLASKLGCLTKTVDGVTYAFAGWFTAPQDGLDNWIANVATQEDVAIGNTLYAYYVNADYLKTTIAYTSNASRASKVFAISTVPADIFANYGFVLSTAASASDENLVIGGKIDGLNVAKLEKTTIYSWISVAPFSAAAPKTANAFNGGLGGVYKDGTDGYISYGMVTNMPIGKTISARAYYTTLDGTVVYGSTAQQRLEANANVTGLE